MASGLLGRLSVIVTADTRQLVTGLQNAAGETKNFNKSMNQILTTLGARFVGVFASAAFAVGELGREVGSVGAEFEKAITVLGAIQGEKLFDFDPNVGFDEAIAPLADAARELGAATTFTATEAAEAMQNLARAGLGTGEIIGSVGAALNFAGANATTLDKSTALLAATMAQFNLTSRDSVRITDTFTVALQNSLLDVRSLTVAMRYAGTIGASLGMSLEQTTAAVAMFRDLGLEGSTAGTQFRQAMLALTSPTKKARDTLDRLGLTVKDINPAIHGFAKVIETLGEKNLTIGEITELVSKRAAGSIAQMAMAFEAGNAKYESLLTKFQTEVGVTERTYERSVDNVFSSLKLVRSAAEDLAIGVFQIFAGDAKVFLVALRDSINKVRESFESVAPIIQRSLDRIRIALNTITPEEREEALVSLTMAFVRLIEIVSSLSISLVKNFNDIKNAIKASIVALMTFSGAIAGGIGLNALKILFGGATKSVSLFSGAVLVASSRIKLLSAAVATSATTFTTLFAFFRNGAGFVGTFSAAITAARASLIVFKGQLAATGLAATLAIPGLREFAIIAGAIAGLKIGFDQFFGDDSDAARTKETVRLFGLAADNVRMLAKTQAGANEELEQAATLTSKYVQNLAIRLEDEGKLNDLIKAEIDFIQSLNAEQAKDLFNRGQLIKVVDAHTGSITLMTAALATQLAKFDDNDASANKFLETIQDLNERVEQLTDSALHLDSVRGGFENIKNVSDEARAVFGELDSSLQGLSKEQLRNALASMEQVDRLNLLDAAKKQLIDTAGLLSTRSRALGASIKEADGQIKKFTVDARLAQAQANRLAKELADEAATKEYINKLKNARNALEKFRATLEEALVKSRGEKRTAQAMKQIRRLTELNDKLEKIEKASFARRLEREQEYYTDIAKIQETEENKIIKDRKKLMTKMINESKKIGRNAIGDLKEENNIRLSEIQQHETDQLELLQKANAAKLSSLKEQRELEQAASLKRLRTRSAERKAEIEINKKFDDRELQLQNEFDQKKKEIKETSDELRLQSAELNKKQMLEIETEALQEILELRKQAEEGDTSPLIRLRAEQKLQKKIFAEKVKGHEKALELNKQFTEAQLKAQEKLQKDIIQSNILIADSFTGILLGLQAGQIGGGSLFGELAADVVSINELAKELENIQELTKEFSKETKGLTKEQKDNVDQNLMYLASLRAVVGFLAKSQSATKFFSIALAGLGAVLAKFAAGNIVKGLENLSEFIDPSEVDETSSLFESLVDNFIGMLDAVKSAGPPILSFFKSIRDFFTKEGFLEDMRAIGDFFKGLGGSIKNNTVEFIDVIREIPLAFSDAKESIGDFFVDLAEGSKAGIAAFNKAAAGGAKSSAALSAGLKGFFASAGAAGTVLIGVLAAVLAVIAANVAAVVGAINLGKKIPGIIMQVTNKFNDLFTTITGGETLNIFDVLKNGINEVVRAMDNSAERVEELRTQFEQGRITAEEFNEAMANLEGAAGQEAAAEQFVDNLVGRSKAFITAFGEVGAIIITRFTAAIPELFNLIRTNGAALLNNLAVNVPAFIGTVISSATPMVVGLINNLANAIPGLVSRLISLLTGALPQLFTQLQSAFGNLFQAIMGAIPGLVAGIKAALPGLLENIRLVNTAIAEILLALVPLFVRDILPQLISSVLKTFTAKARAFILGFGELVRAFVPQLIPVFGEVITSLVPLIAPLIAMLSDLLGANIDLIGKFTPQIIEIAGIFIVAIIDHLPEIVSVIFMKVIPDIAKALAMAMVDAVIGGVGALIQAITDIFLKLFGPIIKIFDADFDISGPGEAIGQFVGDVVGAIESGVDTVVGFFTGIGDAVGGFLAPAFNDTPGAILAGSNGLTASFAAGDYVAAAQEPMELLRQALAANTGALGAMMGGMGSSQPIDIAIMAEGRLLDAVQVRAMDRGHAPKMEKRIRRSGGANIGFNRGRFNKYGA